MSTSLLPEPGHGDRERLAEFEAMYGGGRTPFDYEQRAVESWRHERVARLAAELVRRRVLDLGCGLGQVTRRLMQATRRWGLEVVAMDLSPTAVARARAALGPAPWLLAGSALELPLRQGSFDLVVASDGLVSWHLDAAQRAAALRDIQRVLEPGGHVLLTEHLRAPQWPAFLAEVRGAGLVPEVVAGLHDRPWYWFESWIRAIHGWRVGQALRRSRLLAELLTRVGALLGPRGCRHVLVVARRPPGGEGAASGFTR